MLHSRLTRFGADHLIRQLRTDEATEQVTANALRRFHITARRHGGADLDDVRDRAGLADVRSVRRYAVTTEAKKERRRRARDGRVRRSRTERST